MKKVPGQYLLPEELVRRVAIEAATRRVRPNRVVEEILAAHFAAPRPARRREKEGKPAGATA